MTSEQFDVADIEIGGRTISRRSAAEPYASLWGSSGEERKKMNLPFFPRSRFRQGTDEVGPTEACGNSRTGCFSAYFIFFFFFSLSRLKNLPLCRGIVVTVDERKWRTHLLASIESLSDLLII